MNILVLGCGGMLGDQVYHHFTGKGHKVFATDIVMTSPWVEYLDVRDYSAVNARALLCKADVVMNLAAMTDLEECEISPQRALDVNALGSAKCAAIASTLAIPYVYISTAGIFDGRQEYYDDGDAPNPLGWYAESKYRGELYAQSTPKHIVLRCGWQMGGCEKDKKFIAIIMKQLIAGATELNVVRDKLGSPTYTVDFTRQIEIMLDTGTYGVFNAVCQGSGSRYDVAIELVSLLGLGDKVKVNTVDSSFFAKTYWAPRPPSEKLTTTRLEKAGLYIMRPWQECLRDYVHDNPHFFRIGS